ncbi:uncharacterized protein MYCFIDRAFT_72290 [Pseudocercospora fijiensis CIRAD86]|uniref:Pyrroline-5-carboxylate reductase n=1 Tax=Pseudocercospora fijiensis (strain CIRAD86) TaxID=383855 RepID=M3AYV5_PSEFD|nr:uncharacterized protein MYCFIDRAFT_72290 [Pseudocercospora fijiensis CIRAD86]EME82382.1 hypothetical protein MYCFIDRAFT_72290 [Pseudocercospora fijiensis CIRAD86]
MADLKSRKISFIGGGNMAAAIISGLVSKGFEKKQVTVSEPWDVNRQKMADLGVNTTANNTEAATGADIIILAIKPQVAKTVCQELAASAFSSANPQPLVVSIAAGITSASLKDWCRTKEGNSPAIVRVMPNTPALLGEGASGLYAEKDVSEKQKALATALLQSVSRAIEWVEKEELLDVVTGLSGSGPAYFFAMVEHLVASATKLGLSEEQATRLATQTCLGAGKMLVEGKDSPSQLRKNVTSPNGTTQAGLESFEASGFAAIVDKAVKAATERGEELGRTLGNQ